MMRVMARTVGSMHVATIRRRHGDRVYESHLIRRSVRRASGCGMRRSRTSRSCRRRRSRRCGARCRARRCSTRMRRSRSSVSLPHGHVAALLGCLSVGSSSRGCSTARRRASAIWCWRCCASRLLEPGSKLACARALARSHAGRGACELGPVTRTSSTARSTGSDPAPGAGRAAARPAAPQARRAGALRPLLARTSRDVAVRWPRLGYSRDGRAGCCRSMYGLLCDRTAARSRSRCAPATPQDQQTLPAQLEKLKQRFALAEVVRGRRPRHGHPCQPGRAAEAAGVELDHRVARTAGAEGSSRTARSSRRCLTRQDLAEISMRAIPRRAARRLPQPARGR